MAVSSFFIKISFFDQLECLSPLQISGKVIGCIPIVIIVIIVIFVIIVIIVIIVRIVRTTFFFSLSFLLFFSLFFFFFFFFFLLGVCAHHNCSLSIRISLPIHQNSMDSSFFQGFHWDFSKNKVSLVDKNEHQG